MLKNRSHLTTTYNITLLLRLHFIFWTFFFSLSLAFGLFLYARLACVQSINDSNSAQPTTSQRHTRKVKSGRSQILSTNSLSFTLAHHLQTHTHSLSLQLQKNPSTSSSRLRLWTKRYDRMSGSSYFPLLIRPYGHTIPDQNRMKAKLWEFFLLHFSF